MCCGTSRGRGHGGARGASTKMICVCSVCSTAWGALCAITRSSYAGGLLDGVGGARILLSLGLLTRAAALLRGRGALHVLLVIRPQSVLCAGARHRRRAAHAVKDSRASSLPRGDRRACWQVASQYLVLQRTHRGALWASGAAQAAQVVRIILRFCGELWFALTLYPKPVFFNHQACLRAFKPP